MPRPLVPDRRGRLLGAARELFQEQGWPATTVSDIAVRAGVGKGAVYLEFSSKTGILDALVRESSRRMIAHVRDRVQDADGLVDLAQVYRFGVEALLDDRLMRALFLGDVDVLGEHMDEVPVRRYRERLDWLKEYSLQLQRAGVIDSRIDVDHIVRMLTAFTIGLVRSPAVMGQTSDEDLSAAVTLFADVVSRGLAVDRPADVEAAREAQLLFLRRLDDQLIQLEEEDR